MNKTEMEGGRDGNENQDGISQSKRINCTFSPRRSQSFREPLGYAVRYEAPGVSEANRRSAFPFCHCSQLQGDMVSFKEK